MKPTRRGLFGLFAGAAVAPAVARASPSKTAPSIVANILSGSGDFPQADKVAARLIEADKIVSGINGRTIRIRLPSEFRTIHVLPKIDPPDGL